MRFESFGMRIKAEIEEHTARYCVRLRSFAMETLKLSYFPSLLNAKVRLRKSLEPQQLSTSKLYEPSLNAFSNPWLLFHEPITQILHDEKG